MISAYIETLSPSMRVTTVVLNTESEHNIVCRPELLFVKNFTCVQSTQLFWSGLQMQTCNNFPLPLCNAFGLEV